MEKLRKKDLVVERKRVKLNEWTRDGKFHDEGTYGSLQFCNFLSKKRYTILDNIFIESIGTPSADEIQSQDEICQGIKTRPGDNFNSMQ